MNNLGPMLSSSALLAGFFLLQIAGMLLTPFGVPGPLLQALAAVGLCAITHGTRLGWPWAAGFVVLGLIAEGIDLLAGQFGSKRFGGSSKAAWGALLGGFVGAFFGSLIPIFLIGSVIASFLGTFAGAILGEMQEQKGLAPNLRVGFGAVLGRAVGVGVKLCIAFVILIASAAVVALS